jgi:hypothetical protein
MRLSRSLSLSLSNSLSLFETNVLLPAQTVQGTMLYLFVYFGLAIPFQAFSKFYLLKLKKEQVRKDAKKKETAPTAIDFRAIKYYNRDDTLALVGDRWVGQFQEYSIIFLSLLWIHALFVDPKQSLLISILYSISRGIYPIVFSRQAYPGVLISAFPNYIILTYLGVQIMRGFVLA